MPRRKHNLRLPNGFGSVTYLGPGRRKPWRARKTLGWEAVDAETGKPISAKDGLSAADLQTKVIEKQRYINIGTFETRDEAYMALSNYNKNPYDVEAAKITLKVMVDRWAAASKSTFAESTWARIERTRRRLPDWLLKMKLVDIKMMHLEKALRELATAKSILDQLKVILERTFDYAIKHEYISKNYASFIDTRTLIGKERERREHRPLSEDEIQMIHDTDLKIRDLLLVALYTGMRPQELTTLRAEMVYLDEGYIRHGSKTEAGRDRIIPINPFIRPVLERLIDQSTKGYLFETQTGTALSYSHYRTLFSQCLPGHTPHDTRHTFITRWRAELGLSDIICHLIVGHTLKDVSETVYTHRKLEDLKAEMDRFNYGTGSVTQFRKVGI